MQPEESAWNVLAGLDPHLVAAQSLSAFSESGSEYTVELFGMTVRVNLKQRSITSAVPDAALILEKLAYFSRLSVLHYLIGARAAPLSGRLVRPSELKTGQIYFRGSHVLPLKAINARYAENIEGFRKQGMRFGGKQREYGDCAVELLPLPRIPVTIILWKADEEFEARSDLLLDAGCEQHVPADILWSVAMLSVKVMLADT